MFRFSGNFAHKWWVLKNTQTSAKTAAKAQSVTVKRGGLERPTVQLRQSRPETGNTVPSSGWSCPDRLTPPGNNSQAALEISSAPSEGKAGDAEGGSVPAELENASRGLQDLDTLFSQTHQLRPPTPALPQTCPGNLVQCALNRRAQQRAPGRSSAPVQICPHELHKIRSQAPNLDEPAQISGLVNIQRGGSHHSATAAAPRFLRMPLPGAFWTGKGLGHPPLHVYLVENPSCMDTRTQNLVSKRGWNRREGFDPVTKLQ